MMKAGLSDAVIETQKKVIDMQKKLIDEQARTIGLLTEQNQLLKKHLVKANPEYFKDLFGYYYDDVEDIRKKIAEAGE